MVDSSLDTGPKKVPFSCKLLFSGLLESILSISKCLPSQLHISYYGLVLCNFYYYPYIVERGNSIVNKEALSDVGIKHPKVHVIYVRVLCRSNGVRIELHMEDVSINTMGRVITTLEHRDSIL